MRIDQSSLVANGWTDHVSLIISQLDCTYADLMMFKSLTIDDRLNLTGYISDVDKPTKIFFKKDDDPNDLDAEIGGNLTLNVGAESIKVGNLEFVITHSENYDEYFKFASFTHWISCKDYLF